MMSFVEGENLSKLQEMKAGQNIPLSMRQSRGSKLFKKLALVYGTMFFKLSKMHADPNPGNISPRVPTKWPARLGPVQGCHGLLEEEDE